MNLATRVWRSSVGKKYVMAITGCALFLFVIGHMVGNLQMFLGPEAINRYGHFLQSNVEILWPVRIGLLLMVGLHIASAVSLTRENRRARPMGYAGNPAAPAASYASRTMMMSGLIIAAFVIYHLLHFTVQVKAINLTGWDFHAMRDHLGRHDVYEMVIIGFSNKWVSAFYIFSMALLCLHLSHGVYAMFQSLGVEPGFSPALPRVLAKWGAILIFAGYVSIPLGVLTGVIGSKVVAQPNQLAAPLEKEVAK